MGQTSHSWLSDWPGVLLALCAVWLLLRQLRIWHLQRQHQQQQEQWRQQQKQQQQQRPPSTSAGATSSQRSSPAPVKQAASNLGRIAICASLAGRETNQTRLQGYFSELLSRYTALQEGALTGMLLVHPTSALLMLEGDSTLLLSLTREVAGDLQAQGIREARVVSFQWDVEARLFGSWHAAFAAPVSGVVLSAPPLTPEKWMLQVQDLDLFAKAVGPRLARLDQAGQQEALADLRAFASSPLPTATALLSLAASDTGPTLPEFLISFDLEYEHFKTLAQLGATNGAEMGRLTKLYGVHLLKEQQGTDPLAAGGTGSGTGPEGGSSLLAQYLPKRAGGSRLQPSA